MTFTESIQNGKVSIKTSRNSTNPSGSFSYRHHRAFTSHVMGKQVGFNLAIHLHTSYVFAASMKEKASENVVQAFLSGILAHKDGSVVIFSDNRTEIKKTKLLMKHIINLELKGYSTTYSTHR